jgi:glutathione S-transferase
MTYTLALGDRAYSSWSLRGWLLFEKFNLPVKTQLSSLGTDHFHSDLWDGFAPARTVPAMTFDDGTSIGDSLAMAEELNDRHPEAQMWPADPAARALARMLACEMHSSYVALRTHCPMNLRVAYSSCEAPNDVLNDVKRIEIMWELARTRHGNDGPWLLGSYSIADVMFAPIAARIAGYGLPVSHVAQAYVDAHLNDQSFRQWRALGLVTGDEQTAYRRDYPQMAWPVQPAISATACDATVSENTQCPYSGKPPTHFGVFDGRVFGFCNTVCRDKTVADPEAWPKFMDLFMGKA